MREEERTEKGGEKKGDLHAHIHPPRNFSLHAHTHTHTHTELEKRNKRKEEKKTFARSILV